MAEVLSVYGIAPGTVVNEYSSIVDATLDQLSRLAMDADVAQISEYTKPNLTTLAPAIIVPALFGQPPPWDDIVTLARSAYSHSQSPLPANIAQGVHAATFESGLTQTYLSCMRITPKLWDVQMPGLDPFLSQHSLATFTCLSNAAPGASLYHAMTFTWGGSWTTSYIINNSLTTISMSANLFVPNPTEPEAINIDAWAYMYPYPVIITTTDNGGWFRPAGMSGAYNQINVGNVQDSSWSHFRIDTVTCGAGATQTVNPVPIHSYCLDGSLPSPTNQCAGDRELPYIVSPGYAPHSVHTLPPQCAATGYFMLNSCLDPNFPQQWGTSLSAPTLNGIVAAIQFIRPSLMSQPEAVRAVILTTARNVTNGYWNSNNDGKDGAGVVHGVDAISFAKNMTFATPNSTGAAKLDGYWWGQIGASDFPPTQKPKFFYVKIPSVLPTGKHLRITLTWDSSPDRTNRLNDLSDVDLYFDGVASQIRSQSNESSIEVIDVPNSSITANGTYKITLLPFFWRHSNSAMSATVPASLVWTFVTDHAR